MAEKTRKQLELENAAERRKDYVRALEEELEMCKRSGKDSRVKDITAELKRVRSVKDRGTAGTDEA